VYPQVLCEALALVRCLWMTLRRFLKMQFEVILKSIFLRLLHQVGQAPHRLFWSS
jgi:hypothetical protein